jgi:hypothetical protein
MDQIYFSVASHSMTIDFFQQISNSLLGVVVGGLLQGKIF